MLLLTNVSKKLFLSVWRRREWSTVWSSLKWNKVRAEAWHWVSRGRGCDPENVLVESWDPKPEEAGGLSKKRGKEVNSVNFSRRWSHNGMSQKHLGFGKMNTYSNCLYMYRISLERNAKNCLHWLSQKKTGSWQRSRGGKRGFDFILFCTFWVFYLITFSSIIYWNKRKIKCLEWARNETRSRFVPLLRHVQLCGLVKLPRPFKSHKIR